MDKSIDRTLVLEAEDPLLQVPLISSNLKMDSNKHMNPDILPSHHASKSPFYWGLLSQVALVVSVTTIASFLSIEHYHQLLILYPSAVVLGFGMLHILCAFIFWKKFYLHVLSCKREEKFIWSFCIVFACKTMSYVYFVHTHMSCRKKV